MSDRIGDAPTRVLFALMLLRRTQATVTVRDLARVLDKSVSTVHYHLMRLHRAGLVTWEDGRMSTMRPTVRRVS